jgi:hypothetical protein
MTHLVRDEGVAGSNPATPTILSRFPVNNLGDLSRELRRRFPPCLPPARRRCNGRDAHRPAWRRPNDARRCSPRL